MSKEVENYLQKILAEYKSADISYSRVLGVVDTMYEFKMLTLEECFNFLRKL